MTDNELDRLWQDPNHWKGYFVYHCQRDPRIIVPERHKWMGWTFNFAHRGAYLLSAVIVLALIVPSLDAIRDGRIQDLPLTITFSFLFAVILVFAVSRIGRL